MGGLRLTVTRKHGREYATFIRIGAAIFIIFKLFNTQSMILKKIQSLGNEALGRLRAEKLRNGLSFMINSHSLEPDQCYLEQPDGIILLVSLNRKINDFEIINEYSMEESNQIRKEFKLSFVE